MTLLHGAQSISELRPAAGSIACAGSTSRLPTGSAHLLRSNRSVRGAHVVAKAEAKKGVVILPGLGNCKSDYEELAQRLGERNFDVEIANVKRADWLRNAAGLADSAYWKCTLEPRPTVDWYLTKVGVRPRSLPLGAAGELARCTVSWLVTLRRTALFCRRPGSQVTG